MTSKKEIMNLINNAELLGDILASKDQLAKKDKDDPFIKIADEATDMMATMLLNFIMKDTGLTKEDFAEQFEDYDRVKQYLESDEKLKEAKKEAFAG